MRKSFYPLLPLALALLSCLEPTTPEFRVNQEFYLAEGSILAGGAGSEIRVRSSRFETAVLDFEGIADATVVSQEESGRRVTWSLLDPAMGSYVPPEDFVTTPGERWSFEITLADGTTIASDPETVPEVVPIDTISVNFVQNSTFDEGRDRFIPQFEIFIDYRDPADQANFYAYDFRYWEYVDICISCPRGRYNGIECIQDLSVRPRYDYFCDTDDCYSITEGRAERYGSDEFSNGNAVSGIPIGGIPFQAYGGLLIEAELKNISREAFEYGAVIQDLVAGSSGLNPTIPAALNGNVRNADPQGRTVLGYLGVAASSRQRTYLVRTPETGTALPFDNNIFPEPVPPPAVPPLAPCEVPGRTSVKPAGWP